MRTRLSAWGLGGHLRRLLGVRLGRLHQHRPQPMSVTAIGFAGDIGGLPRISLVTPSFNQASFVGKTIESVLSQGYPDLEYIVQDACSNDGSAEILGSFDGRPLEIHIERDSGQADALNRGFARTSGEIMGYLNSDDLLLPGMLHTVGTYFRDHPEVDVIYGNRLIIDEQGREIGRWILPGHDGQVLRHIDYVPQESMFWRRRIWDKAGSRVDAGLRFAMDWELILRFADAGAVFRHVPRLIGVFRVHGAQKSQADFVRHGAHEIGTLRRGSYGATQGKMARLLHHGRFLYAHRIADAAFDKALKQGESI
ncbi:glycosyltransferase family 2 protein [Rhizobium sp. SGZ-381]|uniref:glycosyltransferase family 2 protein n=1 Tax=Rhizobium sp. SGZ-381 TaxID=3342800 RepID=UPI00366C0FC9